MDEVLKETKQKRGMSRNKWRKREAEEMAKEESQKYGKKNGKPKKGGKQKGVSDEIRKGSGALKRKKRKTINEKKGELKKKSKESGK